MPLIKRKNLPSFRTRSAAGTAASTGGKTVFIDAARQGRRTVDQAREQVSEGYQAAIEDRAPPKKVVVYNVKEGLKRTRHGRVKTPRGELRIFARDVCSGLSGKGLVDYCADNLLIFEGDRPSAEKLLLDFERKPAVLRRLWTLLKNRQTMKSAAASEFARIVKAERDNPKALFDAKGLAQEVSDIVASGERTLALGKKRSRLEAK